MNLYQAKRIGQLLRYSEGNKRNKIPKIILERIQKLIISKQSKIYHYEIVQIYNHLCKNQDQNAFRKLDNILFPLRGQSFVDEVSLILAYRRLYCLVKYQVPYGTWIEKTKQLLKKNKLNSTDFRFLFSLISFQELKLDENFQVFSKVMNAIFLQKIEQIDLLSIIALRRYYQRGKVNKISYLQVENRINNQIQQNFQLLTSSQLKFLFQSKNFNLNWTFHYFLNYYQSLYKKYCFYFYFLADKLSWKQWALKNNTKSEILNKLPNQSENKSYRIVQQIFSRNRIHRQYIDEFFQFKQQVKDGEKCIELIDPQLNYSTYLRNAFYFFSIEQPKISKQKCHQIKKILQDTKYLKKKTIQIFMYLNVNLSILYFGDYSKNEKKEEQIKIISKINQLIHNNHLQISQEKDHNILPTESFKCISSLQFQTYKTKAFKIFHKATVKLSQYIKQNIITSKYPKEFIEMQSLWQQYMNSDPPTQNHFLFGQAKKLMYLNKYQITVAKQVSVNKKVTVNYLIKIKDTESRKQRKILIDFFEQQKQNSIISYKKFWKYHYLVDWCGLNYKIQRLIPFQKYLTEENIKKQIFIFQY